MQENPCLHGPDMTGLASFWTCTYCNARHVCNDDYRSLHLLTWASFRGEMQQNNICCQRPEVKLTAQLCWKVFDLNTFIKHFKHWSAMQKTLKSRKSQILYHCFINHISFWDLNPESFPAVFQLVCNFVHGSKCRNAFKAHSSLPSMFRENLSLASNFSRMCAMSFSF